MRPKFLSTSVWGRLNSSNISPISTFTDGDPISAHRCQTRLAAQYRELVSSEAADHPSASRAFAAASLAYLDPPWSAVTTSGITRRSPIAPRAVSTSLRRSEEHTSELQSL